MATPTTTREEFKAKFDEIFSCLVSSGLPRTQAAAQALLKAKEMCSENISVPLIEPFTLSGMNRMMIVANDTSEYTPIVHSIGKIFSSVDTLVKTLSTQQHSDLSPPPQHDGTKEELSNPHDETKQSLGIDIEDVRQLYAILLSPNVERIRSSISNALEMLTSNLQTFPQSISDKSIMYICIIVLEHPELFDPRYDILLRYLFHMIDKSPGSHKLMFTDWCQTTGIDRFQRYLAIIRHHITLRLYQGAVDDARVTVRVLSLLYSIRKSYSGVLLSEFYIDALNDDYMSTRDGRSLEFKLWLEDIRQNYRHAAEPVASTASAKHSFISFPFVLCPAAKAMILEMDAQLQMRLEMEHELRQAWSSGAQYAIPYLILRVRRDFIIPDTLSQMLGFEDSDFKKPLKVVFDGEEGVDAGGVRKEYYQVMMKQMLDPNFGMFRYFEESRQIWFSPDSLETSMEFELVGLLLGVAIYNSIIIDLPMPLAMYKKLKGETSSLEDLRQLEPTLARGLQALLDFPGDVLAEFQTPFQVSYEVYGEMRTINLRTFSEMSVGEEPSVVTGGAGSAVDSAVSVSMDVVSPPAESGDAGGNAEADVEGGAGAGEDAGKSTSAEPLSSKEPLVEMVTNENRHEYVKAYVSWVMDVSISQQFEAFARGFHKVCGGIAFDLFEPAELELLVCGSLELDFTQLQHGTKYEDGFTAESRVVRDFWTVLLAFDEIEKRLFLKFVSGSDRSPIDGLAHLGFVISKNGADDCRLPSAHTCFNHLLLPEYSSIDVLERKLKLAIHQSEGFGLR